MTGAAIPPVSRQCPFCCVEMNPTANLCSSCGRFSSPKEANRVPGKSLLFTLKKAAEGGERPAAGVVSMFDETDAISRNSPGWVSKALGAVLILCGLALFSFGSWYDVQASLAYLAAGGFVLLWRHLAKPSSGEHVDDIVPETAIRVWNFDINLGVAQVAMLLAMSQMAWLWHTKTAYGLAAICIALWFALRNTSLRILSALFSSVAFAYVLFMGLSYLNGDRFFMQRVYAEQAERLGSLVPIGSFLAVLWFIALFPQLQLIRWGSVRVGNMRGDFHVRLFGSSIPIALISSAVLVSVGYSLFYFTELGKFIIALIT